MDQYLISISIISVVAVLAPFIANAIPKKPIPEVVFLLVAGAILGPHVLHFIDISEPIKLFSELGLAFLFLLAGYEINVEDLKSERGKAALGTWFVSFALAFILVFILPFFQDESQVSIALVIAMTSTALGTLLPIIKERGLIDTTIGKTVLAHGTFGEIMPVLAIAVLLSVRSTWDTLIILLLFALIAIATALFPLKAKQYGNYFSEFIEKTADTTAQSTVRLTVALLVALVTVAALFKLDVVLGAFVAGFVLRYTAPDNNHDLEEKLEGIAYGFFIPLFFVVSGANINVLSVVYNPALLITFMFGLLLVRAIPAFISTYIPKQDREDMSMRDRLTTALYSTTALPIIVAVTHIAKSTGMMDEASASVLVSAGALTVLILPILASITTSVVDAHPVQAAQEIVSSPREVLDVLREHWKMSRAAHREDIELIRSLARQRHLKLDQLRSKTLDEVRSSLQDREEIDALNGVSMHQLRQFIHKRDMFLETMQKRKKASLRGELSQVRDDSWPELKKRGDAQWESIKQESSAILEQLCLEGDKRWEKMKLRGDREWERQSKRHTVSK